MPPINVNTAQINALQGPGGGAGGSAYVAPALPPSQTFSAGQYGQPRGEGAGVLADYLAKSTQRLSDARDSAFLKAERPAVDLAPRPVGSYNPNDFNGVNGGYVKSASLPGLDYVAPDAYDERYGSGVGGALPKALGGSNVSQVRPNPQGGFDAKLNDAFIEVDSGASSFLSDNPGFRVNTGELSLDDITFPSDFEPVPHSNPTVDQWLAAMGPTGTIQAQEPTTGITMVLGPDEIGGAFQAGYNVDPSTIKQDGGPAATVYTPTTNPILDSSYYDNFNFGFDGLSSV